MTVREVQRRELLVQFLNAKVRLAHYTTMLEQCDPGIIRQRARMVVLQFLNTKVRLAYTTMLQQQCDPGIDHSDPSKPSHRLTNGPKPSKTIESDGSKTKNH